MQYSIVNYKELNDELRIDSEYYRPEILNRLNLLINKNNDYLYNLVKFTVGPFGSTVKVENYVEKSNYLYIRNKDINDFIIDNTEPAYIPEDVYISLEKYHIKKEDLLLTVVGTLGKVAIAQQFNCNSIFSCKSTLIRTKKIDPYYLLTYLNTVTGQIFVLRGVRGAIQQGLNLPDLKNIKIFIANESFQKNIRTLIEKSFNLNNKSKELYNNSKLILLKELDLLDWKLKNKLTFIKNYLNIEEVRRIDAEYFQPKYDEIIKAIKKYKCGYDLFGNIIIIKDKNFNPEDEKEYKYIELANISSNGDISNVIIDKKKNLPTRARRKINKDDVIISSIEGSLSCISLITKHYENALCSTGFYVLKSEVLNPETLLVLMKLQPFQELLKKGCGGTILTSISKDELIKIPIPKINNKIQKEIKENIIKSNDYIFKSKALLEIAKKGVEMAIEKNEEEADKWIKGELKTLDINV